MKYRIKNQIRRLLGKPPLMPTRTARLGQDVFNAGFGVLAQPVNIQKGRVDLLFEWMQGKPGPDAKQLRPYIKRDDIFELIEQQATLPWKMGAMDSKWLFMDSYSELVDNKFTHKKEGWSFCSTNGDLRHTDDFKADFFYEGPLPLEAIPAAYENFFQWFFQQSSNRRIIFVHFSDAFEVRQKYLERHAVIRDCLRDFEKRWPERLLNFQIERSEAVRPEMYRGLIPGVHPYHFAEGTVQVFKQRIEQTLTNLSVNARG